MRDLLPDIQAWGAEAQPLALATVVKTWGSAPRAAGAKMVVSADGRIAGSVSGGCVEAAVIEAANEAGKTGRACLLSFGVTDDTAWAVGLACGGSIEIFVEVPDVAGLAELVSLAAGNTPAAVATVLSGPDIGRRLFLHGHGPIRGTLKGPLAQKVTTAARAALEEGKSARLSLADTDVFIEVMRPAPKLVIVGGVHIAIALTSMARSLGYRTIVIDPRPAFGSAERFPDANEIISAWPDEALGRIGLDEESAVAVLTHDPKLDDPALQAALVSPAFYVGALGSKQTQAKRRERLLAAGLTEAQVARLRAPIGLDLGGRSPEEIAVSVLAQVVAVRNRRPEAKPA
jgi:xanthine dehydrogenase accessory factor